MSLIQEALKRQEMEAASEKNIQQEGNAGHSLPSATLSEDVVVMPEPERAEPDTGSNEAPENVADESTVKIGKSRVWPAVLGVVLVLVLAVGAAVYLLSLAVTREPAVAESGVPQAVTQDEPEPSLAVGESPVSGDVAVAVMMEPTEPAASTTVAVSDPVSLPASVPIVEKPAHAGIYDPPAASAVTKASSPAKVEKSIPKQPDEPIDLPPVQWPRLKLTALLCGVAGEESAARINGAMVPEGGEVDGVTVMEIQQEGVLLKLEHETKFLRMGASIY